MIVFDVNQLANQRKGYRKAIGSKALDINSVDRENRVSKQREKEIKKGETVAFPDTNIRASPSPPNTPLGETIKLFALLEE